MTREEEGFKIRLIDADALIEGRVCNDPVVIAVKCNPTIDAVPVVRCCDCKHCDIGTNYFESWCYCKAWRHSVDHTDFCSYGERK